MQVSGQVKCVQYKRFTFRHISITGFFPTLGFALVRDRDFNWSDDEAHPAVAIISRSLAERLFPNVGPIGQRIRFGVMPDLQVLEIVDVAENARWFDLAKSNQRAQDAPVLTLDDAASIALSNNRLVKNSALEAQKYDFQVNTMRSKRLPHFQFSVLGGELGGHEFPDNRGLLRAALDDQKEPSTFIGSFAQPSLPTMPSVRSLVRFPMLRNQTEPASTERIVADRMFLE